jgi:hypothetical protein
MIFSIEDHIQQIINGTKTQTRRKSSSYLVGKTYSIQPGRTKPGIPEGRILIIDKVVEIGLFDRIPYKDAKAEGGYTPTEFEELYEKMYPGWEERYAYTFEFVPSSSRIDKA